MTQRIGIYPGTFDPITKGHLHLIRRASHLVDKLIVSVADSSRKKPMFTQRERLALVQTDIDNLHDKACEVVVEGFDNLLVHYAREMGAACIFRGLRAVSDFDYEFQMTGMNLRIAPDIETVFLMASDKWQFVSASFVKEIHGLGGDISEFVTPSVLTALQDKIDKIA